LPLHGSPFFIRVFAETISPIYAVCPSLALFPKHALHRFSPHRLCFFFFLLVPFFANCLVSPLSPGTKKLAPFPGPPVPPPFRQSCLESLSEFCKSRSPFWHVTCLHVLILAENCFFWTSFLFFHPHTPDFELLFPTVSPTNLTPFFPPKTCEKFSPFPPPKFFCRYPWLRFVFPLQAPSLFPPQDVFPFGRHPHEIPLSFYPSFF